LFRVILEIIAAAFLILFGILFLVYLPLSLSELATDAIFLGAGILILRKAIQHRKEEQEVDLKSRKKTSRQANQRNPRKRASQ
jgi:small neutral amino acid transporter SnatA (MarC family)